MWRKIQSDEQSVQLKIGTIVIEYPVSGRPAEAIDFQDVNNINSYQVILVNPMTGEIDLSVPVMEAQDQALLTQYLNINGLDDAPPVVHKFFEDLKEEGVWWIEEGEQEAADDDVSNEASNM